MLLGLLAPKGTKGIKVTRATRAQRELKVMLAHRGQLVLKETREL